MSFWKRKEATPDNTLLCPIGGVVKTPDGKEILRPPHFYVRIVTTTYLKDPKLYEFFKIAWSPIPPDKDKEREKIAYQIIDMLKRVERSIKVHFGNPLRPREEIFSINDYPNFPVPEGEEATPKKLWKTIILPIARKYA
ncbi:MAG: hypothetical protein QXP38_04165 [Nitrososphaerota archaeon]